MNPIAVVTDKVSLALSLYFALVIFVPPPGYETGELPHVE